jgi:hypothetical protein
MIRPQSQQHPAGAEKEKGKEGEGAALWLRQHNVSARSRALACSVASL